MTYLVCCYFPFVTRLSSFSAVLWILSDKLIFLSYVEDYNEILIEYDIVKAISSNGVIYGTTYVLVDATNLFGKRALKKKKEKSELEHGKHMNYSGRRIRWR